MISGGDRTGLNEFNFLQEILFLNKGDEGGLKRLEAGNEGIKKPLQHREAVSFALSGQ